MTLQLNTANFNVQSLKGAKIFFCFPIFSIFGALASETCIISCYYTPDRRTFFKSLRGAQKSRAKGLSPSRARRQAEIDKQQ